jgi:hypothetical protein
MLIDYMITKRVSVMGLTCVYQRDIIYCDTKIHSDLLHPVFIYIMCKTNMNIHISAEAYTLSRDINSDCSQNRYLSVINKPYYNYSRITGFLDCVHRRVF